MSTLKVDSIESRTSGNRVVLPDTNNYPPFRNIVINGDMSVAQRSTSESSITDSGYHTIDRFKWNVSASDTVTLSQSTDVPSGQGFAKSYKVDVTTADASIGASEFAHIQHRIEAQFLQHLKYGTSSAETLTLSFWVKSTKTGTYCIALEKEDNTRYDYVAEYTISSASTWEKKTITITPDSNIQASGGAIDNNNGEGFNLKFVLAAGSSRQGTNETWNSSTPADGTSNQVNFLDSTSNDFYLTGVQLEVGDSATPFEFLPHDVNLQRCQRYCFAVPYAGGDTYHGIMQGFFPNTTLFIGDIPLPTRMRDSISLTTSGNYHVAGITDYSASSFTLSNSSLENIHSVEFRCTVSGATAGQGARFRNNNDASAKFILSSEL
jgi:hypothetical protein